MYELAQPAFTVRHNGGTNYVLERDNGSARPASLEEHELYGRYAECAMIISQLGGELQALGTTLQAEIDRLTVEKADVEARLYAALDLAPELAGMEKPERRARVDAIVEQLKAQVAANKS